MATIEELVVELASETSGLRADLNKAAKITDQATDKMDKSIEEMAKNSAKNMSFFQTSMATAVGFLGSQAILGSINLLKDGVRFLSDQFLAGVESARAEEVAIAKLNNSLALSGNYSKKASDELANFSYSMEALTGINDDVVLSNLAVLSSITKLNSEGLQKAQKAAIDLAVATGQDLNAATQLVAKGITGQTSAFTRYGFTIAQGANKTENLNNILAALSGTVGAAEAAMRTFDGRIVGINNSYGNFIEAIANAVTKNQAIINVLGVVNQTIQNLTNDVSGNNDAYRKLVAEGLIGFLDGMALAITVVDATTRAIQVLVGVVQAVIVPIQALTLPLVALFTGLDEAIKTFNQSVENTGKNLNAFGEEGDGALSEIATKIFEMRDAAQEGLGAMNDGLEANTTQLENNKTKVEELSATQVAYQEMLKSFAESLADQGASLSNQYDYQLELLQTSLDNQLLTQEEYFAARNELQLAQNETEILQLEDARARGLITEEKYQNARIALAQKQAIMTQKLAADTLKYEDATNKQREANLKSTLSSISSLSSSSNKELAAVGKAAAIAQATIDGYAAVQKALSAAPPPYNFALAALVGTATAANIAKIAGVGLQSGIDSVPGIGNRDNFPAVLAPGERVTDKNTNQDLKEFLANANANGGFGGGNITIEISLKDELVEFIEAKLIERQRVGNNNLQLGTG